MTKKKNDIDPLDPTAGMSDTMEGAGLDALDTDFDLEGEYKPAPLLPEANYLGVISGAKFNPNNFCVEYQVTLQGNEGRYATDGETEADGMVFTKYLSLPKPGDEIERTSRGTMTKRQAKINMMKEFFDKMNFPVNTMNDIKSALENQDWIGAPIVAKVTAQASKNDATRYFNSVDSMVAQTV